jgi:hypothetical protein
MPSSSFTSVVFSKPLRFLITGSITAWDPVGRRLRIDGRRLWVAPTVAVVGVANGVLVIVTDFAF